MAPPGNTVSDYLIPALGGMRNLTKYIDHYERQKNLLLLEESEERYRSIFYDTENVMLLFDPESLIIGDANPAAALYFGHPRGSLIGMKLTQVEEPDETIIRRGIDKILSGRQKHFFSRHRQSDGQIRDVEIFASHVKLKSRSLIYILILDITEKKWTETRLHTLALEMTRIEERERKRVASFLHDEIGQKLAFLRMKLETLSMAPRTCLEGEDFDQIMDLLGQTIRQTQSMIFDLSPAVLYKLGLVKGLKLEGETICEKNGLKFAFYGIKEQIRLEEEKRILLFRCAQELMRNVVKHARARQITLSLSSRDGRIRVILCDDGVGFDPSALKAHSVHSGFGLFSIEERLAGIDGRVDIKSRPGSGTCITLTLPTDKTEET